MNAHHVDVHQPGHFPCPGQQCGKVQKSWNIFYKNSYLWNAILTSSVVTRCANVPARNVARCQNVKTVFFNKSNLWNATKVLKFKKPGSASCRNHLWWRWWLILLPLSLPPLSKNINNFVGFCVSTSHSYIDGCALRCSQARTSRHLTTRSKTISNSEC